MSERLPEDLVSLAAAHGVVTDFWDFDGGPREVPESTLIKVLAALGVDAATPQVRRVALADAELTAWRDVLPPATVVRSGAAAQVAVHVPDGSDVQLWLELEGSGAHWGLHQADLYVEPRLVDGTLTGRATFDLPADLPLGWHRLRAAGSATDASAWVVVVPDRVELPDRLREGTAWGFTAQLYSVRSRQSWGIGDFADLADLGWLSATQTGADFLLVNPLHAAEPVVPMTPSPYLPTTRRFVNPLYIRVEDVRETAYLPAAERSLVEWQAEAVRQLDDDARQLDRDACWQAKKAALEVVFATPRSLARQQAFDAFRAEQGQALEDFATWCALVEHFGGLDWPPEAADPRGAAVRELRAELAARIDFHCWLQWVADEQLATAQRRAREGGMAVGVVHDLAVGVHPEGADVWALRDVLASGVTVGAPPDMYNQRGQDWSQPPWQPAALARAAYLPYRDMLRWALRHAGGLRIDHVIGLFRLWWIPEGCGPAEGAYVRYDHEALIGILCLEAQRAGALVIGEDLGVYEPWVGPYLADRGILGTSVLWFEKDGEGRPLAPEHYRRMALATVTTHDLPPTAGYLATEHVDLRERLGLLTEPVEQVRRIAQQEIDQVVALLAERGLIGQDPTVREVVEALHRLVHCGPAVLFGVSLADAVGERRTQNQPGTDSEYPNWKVPLADPSGNAVLIDGLFDSPRLRSLVRAITAG